jgi:hypothetical protein
MKKKVRGHGRKAYHMLSRLSSLSQRERDAAERMGIRGTNSLNAKLDYQVALGDKGHEHETKQSCATPPQHHPASH